MRFAGLLVGLVVTIVLAVVVSGAVLDEPGPGDEGQDMALRDAGIVTTAPLVSEALDGRVPSAVCAVEERSLDAAIALYAAAEGRPPAAVEDLVAGGWIDEAPAHHRVEAAADGAVAAAPIPGAGCD